MYASHIIVCPRSLKQSANWKLKSPFTAYRTYKLKIENKHFLKCTHKIGSDEYSIMSLDKSKVGVFVRRISESDVVYLK